jgi:hypothetical protein
MPFVTKERMPQAGIGFDTLDTGYDRKTGATFIVRHGGEKARGKRQEARGKRQEARGKKARGVLLWSASVGDEGTTENNRLHSET